MNSSEEFGANWQELRAIAAPPTRLRSRGQAAYRRALLPAAYHEGIKRGLRLRANQPVFIPIDANCWTAGC